MTRLLVSVRNAVEAQAALAGGAAVIDVKEPHRGSLGRADAQTLRSVCEIVAQRAPLSAALGEITEPPDESFFASVAGYQFAKFGLAGALDILDWKTSWQKLVEQLPRETSPVAVIYADWGRCRAPAPSDVLAAARELRCPIALVDTFFKDGRSLFSTLSLDEIQQLIEHNHRDGRRIVLAGGIDARGLEIMATLKPDLVGVRGAVCRRGRAGELDERLVRELAQRLHE